MKPEQIVQKLAERIQRIVRKEAAMSDGLSLAMQDEYVAELQPLADLIRAAQVAINSAGHKAHCSFRACTCGAVEDFKENRLEFFRLLAGE